MPAPLVAVAPALTNLPSGPRGAGVLPFPPAFPLPSPPPILPNRDLPAITPKASAAAAAAAANAVAAIVVALNPFSNGFIDATSSSTLTLALISISVSSFLAFCAGSVAATPPAVEAPAAAPFVLLVASWLALFSSRSANLPVSCNDSLPKKNFLPKSSPPYCNAVPNCPNFSDCFSLTFCVNAAAPALASSSVLPLYPCRT